MKRLLHFRYYEDTVNLLLENPTEQLVNDIKLFYKLKDYLKLKYDVVITEIIEGNGLSDFETWKEDELLELYLEQDEYEGELLEIVKRILSYKKQES